MLRTLTSAILPAPRLRRASPYHSAISGNVATTTPCTWKSRRKTIALCRAFLLRGTVDGISRAPQLFDSRLVIDQGDHDIAVLSGRLLAH